MRGYFLLSSLLATFLCVPAQAGVHTVSCRKGSEGKNGYRKISFSANTPIRTPIESGLRVTVVLEEVVKIGRVNTTITTDLVGKILRDNRPLTRPDPLTIIELAGRNETGRPTRYGMLFVRPSLSAMESVSFKRSDGDEWQMECEGNSDGQ